MTTLKPKLLLWTICILPTVTLITTYTITEKLGHTNMKIPFISSSINQAPESCIGTLGLSITSFIMVLVTFIKYLITKFNIDNDPYTGSLRDNTSHIEQKRHRLNILSISIGILSAFGMLGVASFQYRNAGIVHLIFATMFFLGGVSYMIVQTYLDSILALERKVLICRKIMTVASIFLFFPYLILQFVNGEYRSTFQNVSAVFEISSALTLFLYFITYFYEFSQLKLHIDFTYPQSTSRVPSYNPN
ncbi:hypothetical protein DLAC_03225 [Tieghemostelium lacteum]|uniref:CWH43-like N-terminal domain-containing protein n=1 Tax=Tieghemostelium lacteum TaxID=361077 RepID=A0A152A1F3_TIELA|nr:hypothetical protein DLAC_03225 [Tieghemostelium lacteum]|eukprot:KYR00078.1 hypothetical protein DLAC_03225 [Tieghemostelium lacteum]